MTDQHLDSDGEFGRWSRPPRTTPPVIDRRVLSNGEVEEWERPATIPDDFIYDPETHSYYAPGEPADLHLDEWRRNFEKVLEEIRNEPPIPSKTIHATWLSDRTPSRPKPPRKPRPQEQYLFSGLFDDDASTENEVPRQSDSDRDESADDPS